MTLPTSGPLSLSDIKGEFGGNASPALEDYYAGGSFVPSGTSGTNGPVPTSGTIGIFNFYGTSHILPLTVTVSPGYLYKSRTGTGSITSNVDTGSGAGGVAPYTYAWTYVSGDSYTINSPASAATTFTTAVSSGATKSGVYRCTVTDSASTTAHTDVTIDFEAF